MDLAVLASLGESARRTRRELDARARDVVESHLRGRDALLARGAVLLTGQIESADSIGVLIDLLASEDRALREAAHWSLQRITRLQFGADGARWLAWHEQELLWSSTRSAAVFDLLGSDRLEHVTAGLQEISEHRLDRAALAGAVVPVLEHPEPAARRLACAVLGKLASDRAKSALEGHLTDADASVVQAAQAALGSIAAGDVSAHAASR
jgi:HEAT repeat protein